MKIQLNISLMQAQSYISFYNFHHLKKILIEEDEKKFIIKINIFIYAKNCLYELIICLAALSSILTLY
jgi:hypothetical protein